MSGGDAKATDAGELPHDRKRRLATARKRRERYRLKNSLARIEFDVPIDVLTAAMIAGGWVARPSNGRQPDPKKVIAAYLRVQSAMISKLSRRDANILQDERLREIVNSKRERVDVDEVR